MWCCPKCKKIFMGGFSSTRNLGEFIYYYYCFTNFQNKTLGATVSFAILAKGRCFFGPLAKGLRSHCSLNLLTKKQINTARGYSWEPSSS
jgi:hypothetical protein